MKGEKDKKEKWEKREKSRRREEKKKIKKGSEDQKEIHTMILESSNVVLYIKP